MMNKNNNQIIFSHLHPICVNLMNKSKNQTKCELVEYHEKLNEILTKYATDSNDIKLAEYLLLPVFENLNSKCLNLTHQEVLFNILSSILSKLTISRFDLFLQILNKSTFLMSSHLNSKSNNQTQQLYDEYFESYMNLLKNLLQKRNTKLFYDYSQLTTIGLLISILLDILTRTDTLNIRLNAIQTLSVVCNLDDQTLDYKLGTILTAFLPGITIKLIQNFLFKLNLSVVNHKLVCSTIDVLKNLLGLVLNDDHVEQHKFNDLNKLNVNDDVKNLIVNRSANVEWARNTRKHLKVLIEQLVGRLINHDSYFIRLKMNEFCDYLICSTSFSLLTSQKYSEDGKSEDLYFINRFLNLFLINSMDDSNELVHVEGEKSVERLKKRLENSDEPVSTLYHICSNNLESLILSRSENLSFKFKLIYSYLNLINKYSSSNEFYLSNTRIIKKLLHKLVSSVKFNYKNLNNLYVQQSLPSVANDEDSDDVDDVPFLNSDILRLTNTKGLEVFLEDDNDESKQVDRICQLFGKNLTIFRLICDLMLSDDEIYKEKSTNEILFLFISMINGMADTDSADDKEKYSIVKYLLSILIVTNEDSNEDSTVKPLTEQNYEIINTSLSLQLLACSSKFIKADQFKQIFLLDILYPILKHYQNENLLIKAFSYRCLDELSRNLGYTSVKELLSMNYDYIINSLYLSITGASSKKSYLFVLCSLINICNVDIVGYLHQILENLFINLQMRIYSDDFGYLKIFCYSLIYLGKSIQKWYSIRKPDSFEDRKKASKSYKELIDEINEEIARHKAEFIKYHEQKAEKDEKEEQDEEEMEKFIEDNKPKEKTLPVEIKIQIKCLEICQHLISYPNRQICLLVIEIIKSFSLNLVYLNCKDELLPLLHKLWQPMMKQFCIETSHLDNRIGNSGIVYRINICLLKLLMNLIEISDTFLIKRLSEEFLPVVVDFMRKQSKLSFNYKQRNDTTYVYSSAFKLQNIILKFIPKIYSNSTTNDTFF